MTGNGSDPWPGDDDLGDAVTLGYVHDVEVTHSFHDSLVNLLMLDTAHQQRILRGGYIKMRCAKSSDLPEARNKLVAGFLLQKAAWLFIVDTDMGFAPDTLERLLAVADPTERPIVGALCFAWAEHTMDGMAGFRCSPRPTIMDWVKTPAGETFAARSSYPADSVTRCAGTGAACIVIHRSVFERIEAEHGPTWFNRIAGTDGRPLGEDVSFCIRVGALGIPIHVHTGVKTTHMKHIWVGEDDFIQAFPQAVTNGDGTNRAQRRQAARAKAKVS